MRLSAFSPLPRALSKRTRLIRAPTTPILLAAGVSGALVSLHAGTSLAQRGTTIASCAQPTIGFGASAATPASVAPGGSLAPSSNAEMVYGWIRNCYEDWADYLYQQPPAGYPAYHAGDIWSCVGFYERAMV